MYAPNLRLSRGEDMGRTICAFVSLLVCACGGGSGPKPLASGEAGPVAIAADLTSVYWLNGASGELRKVALTGGAASTLASGFSSPRALTIDSDKIYWASGDGSVRSVSVNGGDVTTIAT